MKSFTSGLLVLFAVSSIVHGNEFDDEGHKNFNHAFENWRNTFLNKHAGGGGGGGAFFWPKLHFVEPDFRDLDASVANGRPNDAKDREPLDIDFISGQIGNPDVIETLSGGNSPAPGPQNPGASFPNDPFGLSGFASFFDRPASQGFNGFPGFQFFNLRQNQPWWKGPNVCTEREEDLEETEKSDEIIQDTEMGSIFSGINLNIESCVEKSNKHVCKKITNFGGNKRTVTITHRCCQGYGRPRTPGMSFNAACEKLNLRTLFDAAEHLGAKEFIKTAKNNELDRAVVNKTLFLPNDAAFSEFTEQMFENNLVVLPISRQRRLAKRAAEVEITSKDLIMGHFVDGIVSVDDIQNEQLLTTNFGNTTIRMNIFPRAPSQEDYDYPYRYTANCVPLTKVNQMTQDGMIHMVERVIQPTTRSLLEIIRERNDMTVLRTVLEKTKMDKFLDESKHLTIFAPTDKAFEKLSPVFRRKLKEGSGCAINIIKNHILDLTFCSAAVDEMSHTITHNLLGEKIDMQMEKANQSDSNELNALDGRRRISINKMAYMLETDIMATNGVVHVIDTILPTDSGLPVSTALQNNNLTVFQRLLEASGLEDDFDDLQNVTFFVPSDKAFETDSKTGKYWLEQLEANADLKDNAELKEFIENHIAEPLIKTCDLAEKTIRAKSGAHLKVNLYTTHPIFVNIMNRATVNCARITNHDEETCGSVVHQVDKVLENPKMTILQTLEANKEYSMFLKFVKMANLTDMINAADKDLTLLVPKDDTFNEVQEWYTKMLANPDDVEHIVKSHIVPSALCCAGIVKSEWPFIRFIETLNGQQLKLNRDRRPQIANAGVTRCDIIAKNGVIHEINDIIATRPREEAAQPAQSQPTFFNQQLPSFW